MTAISAGIWALYAAHQKFTTSAQTSWWQPGIRATTATLHWEDVYQLIAYDDDLDPLGLPKKIRWRQWGWSLFAQVPLYLIIGGVVLSAIDLICGPSSQNSSTVKMVEPSIAGPKTLAAAIESPTAYLALIVALATIFFAFRQIRAKVRADSRQQWIIQARKLLGEVVALIDTHKDLREANRLTQAREIWTKLNPARIELELMLNPSEKDHRLLLYLIQRFARWRRPDFETQDAQIVRRSIAKETSATLGLAAGESDPRWKPIIDGEDRAELISYILRLSHVVLKREWERVKHTR